MNILSPEEQLSALKGILFQLELAASRVTDCQFKQYGCTGLNKSIQDCKKLIKMSEQLSIYDQISQYTDMIEGYGDCLGLHNTV